MKIMHVKKRIWNRSSQLWTDTWKMAWKKIQARTEFEPKTSAILVPYLVIMLHPNQPPKAVNIWKSYMCTAVEETNIESILAVMIIIYLQPLFTTWKVYWPAFSSLVGSVGRALHWYSRGHGFKSRAVLTFLRPYFQKFWKRSLYQWKLFATK